jgi:type II protein arginine methyltransferase
MQKPEATIAALLPRTADNPMAMVRIARLMQQDGQSEEAIALCRSAMALAPGDRSVQAHARRLLTDTVPGWHFFIVRDAVRNAAYDAALRRAVRPSSRVLEIGTGTGLLAMMAARAGAAQVVTCEMNPLIAETARKIIAQNGYAGRVRVVSKHSDELDVETDLGGRADILVSEIVSNNLLGEDVLPAHEHAMREFVKPGGRVIPARGHVRIALGEDLRHEPSLLADTDGFDLSPMNVLLGSMHEFRVGHERLKLRSAAIDLFEFDFASAVFCPPSQVSVDLVSSGGRINGIAQWIRLDMDDAGRYENQPARGASSCWGVMFHSLPRPLETAAGQTIRVGAAHDRRSLTLWAEDDPGDVPGVVGPA